MRPVLSKTELKRIIRRFFEDKERGISIPLFAELAGVSQHHLRQVFLTETEPLTEYVQRRVSKAYQEWRAGNVRVMKNRDNTRFVEYRKTPEPPIFRSTGLKVTPDGIKLRVGLVNRHDYSELDLDEALRG
jgi:hypothetical protein